MTTPNYAPAFLVPVVTTALGLGSAQLTIQGTDGAAYLVHSTQDDTVLGITPKISLSRAMYVPREVAGATDLSLATGWQADGGTTPYYHALDMAGDNTLCVLAGTIKATWSSSDGNTKASFDLPASCTASYQSAGFWVVADVKVDGTQQWVTGTASEFQLQLQPGSSTLELYTTATLSAGQEVTLGLDGIVLASNSGSRVPAVCRDSASSCEVLQNKVDVTQDGFPTDSIIGTGSGSGSSCDATQMLIPEYSQSSASSVYGNDDIGHRYGQGKLDSPQAWSAGTNTAGQYWQMDLGSAQSVAGVVTQGRSSHTQYVKSYKVQVSGDGSSWSDVDGGNVFTANSNVEDKVENLFASAVSARFVRIVVQTWNSHISMRSAVLRCTAEISSCTASVNQNNFHCNEAFDGITSGTSNGWAYSGNTPAWAAFELSSASSVQGLSILSGAGRTNHRIQDFKVELKVDGTYQDTANVQVEGGGATITGSRAQFSSGQGNVEMSFDAVTCTAVKLTVYSTDASNNNLVLTEMSVVTATASEIGNLLVMGSTLQKRTCALQGVAPFTSIGGEAVAQIDPNYRDPATKQPLCFPLATMVFFAGVVADSSSAITRSVALQIEPHGRLRVLGEENSDIKIRLDGIVFHPYTPFNDAPTSCVPYCFPPAQEGATGEKGSSGCVKYCAPEQYIRQAPTESIGDTGLSDNIGSLVQSNCRCDIVKRLDCWKHEGSTNVQCGQFKTLVRTYASPQAPSGFDATTLCGSICAQQLVIL